MGKILYSDFAGMPRQAGRYAAQGGSLLRGLARSVKRAARCYAPKRRRAVRDATANEAEAVRWWESADRFATAFEKLAAFMAEDRDVAAAMGIALEFERMEAESRREFVRRAIAAARSRGDGPDSILAGGAR